MHFQPKPGISVSSSLALQYSDGEMRWQYQKPTRLCCMHICSQGNMVMEGDSKASTKMRSLIRICFFTVQRQAGVRGMFLHYEREIGVICMLAELIRGQTTFLFSPHKAQHRPILSAQMQWMVGLKPHYTISLVYYSTDLSIPPGVIYTARPCISHVVTG